MQTYRQRQRRLFYFAHIHWHYIPVTVQHAPLLTRRNHKSCQPVDPVANFRPCAPNVLSWRKILLAQHILGLCPVNAFPCIPTLRSTLGPRAQCSTWTFCPGFRHRSDIGTCFLYCGEVGTRLERSGVVSHRLRNGTLERAPPEAVTAVIPHVGSGCRPLPNHRY